MEPTLFSFIWKYSKRRQLAPLTVLANAMFGRTSAGAVAGHLGGLAPMLHMAGTGVPDIDDGARRDV